MSISSEKVEQSRILLESGTNEVEMLEFYVGNQYFAVNVAKVQTLVQHNPDDVTNMPEVHSQVKHMIKIHDQILPMLKLTDILHIEDDKTITRKIVVLLQFNNLRVAILVDGVVSIHRMSWNDFTPISNFISLNNSTAVDLAGQNWSRSYVMIWLNWRPTWQERSIHQRKLFNISVLSKLSNQKEVLSKKLPKKLESPLLHWFAGEKSMAV